MTVAGAILLAMVAVVSLRPSRASAPEDRCIALRDIGLALGALALARMATDAPQERSRMELPA